MGSIIDWQNAGGVADPGVARTTIGPNTHLLNLMLSSPISAPTPLTNNPGLNSPMSRQFAQTLPLV